MALILTTAVPARLPARRHGQLTAGRTGLTVDGKPVLAKVDVVGKAISGCATGDFEQLADEAVLDGHVGHRG